MQHTKKVMQINSKLFMYQIHCWADHWVLVSKVLQTQILTYLGSHTFVPSIFGFGLCFLSEDLGYTHIKE